MMASLAALCDVPAVVPSLLYTSIPGESGVSRVRKQGFKDRVLAGVRQTVQRVIYITLLSVTGL